MAWASLPMSRPRMSQAPTEAPHKIPPHNSGSSTVVAIAKTSNEPDSNGSTIEDSSQNSCGSGCDLQHRNQDLIHSLTHGGSQHKRSRRRAGTTTGRETTIGLFFLNHMLLQVDGVKRKWSLRGNEPQTSTSTGLQRLQATTRANICIWRCGTLAKNSSSGITIPKEHKVMTLYKSLCVCLSTI
jgi:hypothetical protein